HLPGLSDVGIKLKIHAVHRLPEDPPADGLAKGRFVRACVEEPRTREDEASCAAPKERRAVTPLCTLLPWVGLLFPQDCPCGLQRSYLYQPAFCIDYELRQPAEAYLPQPGDIFLATGREYWAKVGHWLARTGAPQHSGIVVAWPDGRLLLLEAGP